MLFTILIFIALIGTFITMLLIIDGNFMSIITGILTIMLFVTSYNIFEDEFFPNRIKSQYNYHSVSCKKYDTIPNLNTYLCDTYTLDSNNILIKQTNLFAVNNIDSLSIIYGIK